MGSGKLPGKGEKQKIKLDKDIMMRNKTNEKSEKLFLVNYFFV